MLLNIQWIAEEIKQEKQTNKKLETTENETTTIQTLQDTVEPVPSIQYRASNLDWRLISYMILYIFQCHSPKPSHPALSHRVQKTVLYIFVPFAVLHTGLLLPSF